MEKQLFTWGSWDLCDNLFIAFMNLSRTLVNIKRETKYIVLI